MFVPSAVRPAAGRPAPVPPTADVHRPGRPATGRRTPVRPAAFAPVRPVVPASGRSAGFAAVALDRR